MTTMNFESSTESEQEQKRKRGRPQTHSAQDRREKNKEYQKQYYQDKLKHTPCECSICGSHLASKQQLRRHRESVYCQEKLFFKMIPEFAINIFKEIIPQYINNAQEI
jgi:hypothetical protein